MATNIITAAFGGSKIVRTRALYQWDYGQVLQFLGIDLPDAYTVHFSNVGVGGEAKTQVGNVDGVDIPDEYLTSGQTVYAWVYLHTGDSDGETVYSVIIPVVARPRPTEDAPTPVQRGLIEQAIAALNAGVEDVQEAVEGIPDVIDAALTEAKESGEFDGPPGPQGERGEQGPQGIQGPKGDTGATGAQGPQGEQGEKGPKGDTGATGPKGDKGDKGDTGAAGQDGAPGVDGVSPSVTVTDITGGHRVTVTDASGTRSFDVMDGADGQPGQPGPQGVPGPGLPSGGTAGQVAVKASGTDYDVEWSDDLSDLKTEIEDVETELNGEYTVPLVLTAGKYIKSGSIGTDFTTLFVDNGSSVYTAASAYIPSEFNGMTLRIYWDNHDNSSARKFGFCDAANKIVAIYSEDTLTYKSDDYGVYFDAPIVSNYMFFSTKTSFGFKKAVCRYSKINVLSESIIGKTAYVARTGSDDNSGDSPNAPLATVNKALEKGFSIIRVFGGKLLQKVDLSKAKSNKISITAFERDNRPIFMDASAIIGTSATAVSGYTKVMKITKSLSAPSDLIWIYQDSVSDVSTLISDSERHPLQRGKVYRCDDTKIVKCTADNLSDALAEIEAADTYKWYKDGNDWYFSCPDTVTSNKPLCAGVGNSFFAGLDRSMTLNISGIAVKYMSFNISGTVNSVIADCKCSDVTDAGAFIYDNCLNAQFLRCEAEHCAKGGNGDGFNAHATGASTGPFAKCSTGTMIDCWSHDNLDDGYSNHQRGEDTIIGGLFEYNGKAGVTPSYGTHCTCYNVLSRQNNSGFYCIGEADSAEGGVGTQLVCYGCVSANNMRGGMYSGFYVAHAGNSMMLYNCKAIGNNRAYRAANVGSTMLLVDCTVLDNAAEVKYGDGTITVKNTTAVT